MSRFFKLTVLFASLVLLFLSWGCKTETEIETYNNPVIPGFHPDPSVCRVGEDYYLVNSSFEWFPGIPIYHSKDLVNWKPIGHVLTRPSQLKMVDNKFSSGVWAPTIRYHEGTFYVTATCMRCGRNFYVSSDKPEGPYSDPIYIDAPNGIDPSFYFDEEGRAWFSANRKPKEREWEGHTVIYVQEIDIKTGELLGERYDLTTGFDEKARATEGPHIYKVDNHYYMVCAEGGTWEDHAISLFRSEKITGPYEPVHNNLVLTHRHLKDNPVTSTGHADLVQTQNGEWWAVLLGVRPLEDRNHWSLGRETFLVPVEFKDSTFVFAPEHQQVMLEDKRPNLPWTPVEINHSDDFSSNTLDFKWNFLRTPLTKWHSLSNTPGWLEINLRPETVKTFCNPSFIARRFQHHQFTALTKLKFEPKADNETAGLVAMQNHHCHYRLVLSKTSEQQFVKLYKVYNKSRKIQTEQVIDSVAYAGNEVVFGMKVSGMDVMFSYGKNKESLQDIGGVNSVLPFSSRAAGGFIGAYVGMYASSNGEESDNKALFDWFEYIPNE
ncbi:MAG: glycoside hydrolase family 43 protein [Bacteroidales bacterium]|nr:glycoside hydrolase family 43 protein [Bacteroidales bacterium]